MANHLERRIAYFSMEIAVDPALPTYAGGLGVLAGDFLHSAADLGVPIVGVTLLCRKGYFRQELDGKGQQMESPDNWAPENCLKALDVRIPVILGKQTITVKAWRYSIQGISGFEVPVYFLDTGDLSNPSYERSLSDYLYGGDEHYRLCQEVVLGIGGVRMLRALGFDRIDRFHMNEGHSALLALALLEERKGRANLGGATSHDIEDVRRDCIFTTHTPVPAGQDQFPRDLAASVLGPDRMSMLEGTGCCNLGKLNMTYLGLRCSGYVNGVAMRHGEISQGMFPDYPIHAITNGVHAVTWTSKPFQDLFDHHIPEWRKDNLYLRYAIGIDLGEIVRAHALAKRTAIEEIEKAAGVRLSEHHAVIGFARRAAAYKRSDLVFSDLNRLREIREKCGPFQLVFGGKAHPKDEDGKAAIRNVFQAKEALKDCIPVVYIENHDLHWASLLTSGVDLWLNTPHRPFEASGTSGMKAALNGVPSLSIRDGWWLEGHFEGITGWAIGYDEDPEDREIEIASLYEKLEHAILPLYYTRPKSYAAVMRSAIALNGAFFNTQRMIAQYVMNAYFPREEDLRSEEAASFPGKAETSSPV
ncbi:MAG TPA: alpha-glucan family phosphorylase [Candidatus Acidoferrum sp.]|nr:alpha-glucan family phosphorylase [Candidatus Acidoferrum sp.]